MPSSYWVTDQILEIELDSWDPGEDETDDQRRRDIENLHDARPQLDEFVKEVLIPDYTRADRRARNPAYGAVRLLVLWPERFAGKLAASGAVHSKAEDRPRTGRTRATPTTQRGAVPDVASR